MKRLIAVASALALSVLLIGCETVQPWQKGNLAKPEMVFDPDPLQTRFDGTHVLQQGRRVWRTRSRRRRMRL